MSTFYDCVDWSPVRLTSRYPFCIGLSIVRHYYGLLGEVLFEIKGVDVYSGVRAVACCQYRSEVNTALPAH